MVDTLWYQNMTLAMKRREKANKAIQKWQLELAEAEAEIQALREEEEPTKPTSLNISTTNTFGSIESMPSVVTNNP